MYKKAFIISFAVHAGVLASLVGLSHAPVDLPPVGKGAGGDGRADDDVVTVGIRFRPPVEVKHSEPEVDVHDVNEPEVNDHRVNDRVIAKNVTVGFRPAMKTRGMEPGDLPGPMPYYFPFPVNPLAPAPSAAEEQMEERTEETIDVEEVAGVPSTYTIPEARDAPVPAPADDRGTTNSEYEGGGPGVEGAAVENPGTLRPVYPRLCQRLGHQGKTVIRIRLEPDGTPSHLEVIESAGCPDLDRAAVAAARRARFRPARHFGKPVASTVELPIRFQLR